MTAQPLVAPVPCHATPGFPHSHRPLHVRPVPDIDAPIVTDFEWEPVERASLPTVVQPPLPFPARDERARRDAERGRLSPPAADPSDPSDRAAATDPVPLSRREAREIRESLFDRQPTATAQLPDAQAAAAGLARALTEIAAGGRPPSQIMRYCSPEVFDSVVRRHSHRAGQAARRRPVVVRRVRVCHVRDGVVEVAVVLAEGHRVRPLALRLEGLDGRWMMTALEWG